MCRAVTAERVRLLLVTLRCDSSRPRSCEAQSSVTSSNSMAGTPLASANGHELDGESA